MRSIDRWFKPKNRDIIRKEGIPMTRWQYMETVYGVQRIQAEKKKRRKLAKRSLRQQGKIIDSTAPSVKLKTIGEKLKEGSYDLENAMSSWDLFVRQVQAQSTEGYIDEKNAMYYNNYHTAIYENFSDVHAKLYADFLEDFRLSGEELFSLIGEYPALDIDFMYGPEEEENKFLYLVEMLPMAVEKVMGKEVLEAGMERFHRRMNTRGTSQERLIMEATMRESRINSV